MNEILEGRIPALSIRQPWAELIISGKKSIEIRSWISNYRGYLWIHAGRKVDLNLEREYGFTNIFHGGFIGLVTIEEIMPFDVTNWRQWRSMHLDKGEYQPFSYAWILSNPIRFEKPIIGSGRTSLFLIDEILERELKHALITRSSSQ